MKRNIKTILLLITLLVTIGVIVIYLPMFNGVKEFLGSGFIIYIGLVFGIVILSSVIPVVISIRNGNIKNNKISTENLGEDSKFDLIYTEIRQKYAEELAKIRKGLRPITIIVTIIGLATGGMFVWMKMAEINMDKYLSFILDNQMLIKVVPVVSVLCFFAAFAFYSFKKSDYDAKYKTGVVKDIVSKANNGLTYDRKAVEVGSNVLEIYKTAAFDNHYFNRNQTEDYIHGKLTDNLSVSIAELDLDHVMGSRKNRKTVDVFDGLVVHVKGITSLKGTIKILNNNNKRKDSSEELSEVKMDSSEFENIFNVYADDSVLTMRILTSDIMQKMVEFEKRLGVHFETYISAENLVMRFFTTELFEPAIFNESREKDRVRAYYEIIKLITDISIELDKTISEVEV